LGMKLWTLTDDRLQELKRQYQEKAYEVEQLEATTLEELWERDLVKLDHALDQIDRDDAKEAEAAAKLVKKSMGADMEGLVNRQCVLVLTQDFKAKRVKTSEWKAVRKGKGLNRKGALDAKVQKGLQAEEVDEDAEADFEKEALRDVFCCYDFDALLVFTEEGNVFSLQALDVPAAKTVKSKATPIKEFMPDIGDEHITAIVTVPQKALRDQSDEFVVLVSAGGLAKKVSVDKFRSLETSKTGKKGVMCFKLAPDDKLKWALRGTENSALAMVTEKGFVLRCSLGPDWPVGGAKATGKRAMRITSKGGDLAACCVAEMTKEEVEAAEVAKALALEKRKIMAEKRLASEKAAAEGGDATAAAMEDSDLKAKAKKECDDDDSDNAGDDAAGDDAADVQDEEEEAGDEEDVDMKDAEDGDKPTPDPALGDSQVVAAPAPAVVISDYGPSLLMISENGWGMRVPFTNKRVQMARKGRAGLKVMKITDSDDIIGVVVVGGRVEVKLPADPRNAFKIWYAENRMLLEQDSLALTDETRSAMEGEATKDAETKAAEATKELKEGEGEEKAVVVPSVPGGFLIHHMGQKKFRELPASEIEPFEKRAEQEKEAHEKAMEEYRKDRPESEQVMLASQHGFISRIMVDSVPVIDKRLGAKGIRVVKIKGRDALSSVSLLTAADDTPDEAAALEAAALAAAPVAVGPPPREEGDSAPEEEDPDEEKKPKATTPRRVPLKRALPSTPPTNRQASHSDAAAAAALLGTPMESPGRRIRGKRPASEVGLSPSVADRSVARPSQTSRARSSSAAPAEAPAATSGRGRGAASVRKALGKRSLGTLRLTQPAFD